MKVRTDKVTALEVEAVQLVASLLCIHHVVIDNEGCTLCVGSNALANLAVEDISTVGEVGRSVQRHVPNRAVLAEELKELFRCHVVAVEQSQCQCRST